MRIFIETDEQPGSAASRSTASTLAADASSTVTPAPAAIQAATDAGPPSAQLLQAIGEAVSATAQPDYTGTRAGLDGGGPPLELVQALRRTPSETSARGVDSSGNGGGAPL
jgi:hypothetical protein